MRIRAELGARWRAWLGLALLLGMFGGAAVAAAAGARRTSTAYPRFVEAQNGFDVLIGSVGEEAGDPAKVFAELNSIPQVAQACYGKGFVSDAVILPSGRRVALPDVLLVSGFEGACGGMNRAKILDGRDANPDSPDEATVSFVVADRFGIAVDDRLELPLGYGDESRPSAGVRVVGIEAAPGEFESISGGYLPIISVTPGFVRAHADLVPIDPREGPTITLKRGLADVEPFMRELARRKLPVDVPMKMPEHIDGVQRSIRFEAAALWALSGLIALATVAVFGQALARQTFLDSMEHPTLRALGMSRGQLVAAGLVRAALIGTAGGACAVAVAIGLSPLAPIGLARIAEPSPGVSLDAAALGAGGVGILLLIPLVAAVPSWRAARARGSGLGTLDVGGGERPSFTAGMLARASAPPSAVAGVRMALEPGKGRTAVPVRTTIFGTAVALAAVAMAVTFAASMNRLLVNPRLSGYTWDAIIALNGEEIDPPKKVIAADPAVATAWEMDGGSLVVGGLSEPGALAFDLRGPFRPAMVEGRFPTAADEIALGSETMRRIDARIGSTVQVSSGGDFEGVATSPALPYRVVGRAAVPQFFFAQTEPGRGAVLSFEGLERLPRGEGDFSGAAFFVNFKPGVDRDEALRRLVERLRPFEPFPLPSRRGASVSNLSRITDVPLVLAAVLAAMAAGILGHTLATAIRRRRRDIAILKTLGFVRRQVRAVVAWQATAITLIALAIGLPVGIAGGRWLWRIFAEHLAVVPEPVVPVAALGLGIPAALVLANLVAGLPGRAAGRMRPGLALRTE